MMFKFISKDKINDLLTASGVYSFNKGAKFLYVGKAVNIKERVQNHFQQPGFKDNIFIPETEKIGFIATNSEIEALILEAELIKKFQPKYNTQWKDDKNYYFVVITDEKWPRVFVTHQLVNKQKSTNNELNTSIRIRKFVTNSLFVDKLPHYYIGPFVDGKALKQALRVLRRIFPFRTCKTLPKKPCLYKDLNLCQAPCQKQNYELRIKNYEKEYKDNIRNLTKVLQGQKISVGKNLQKEMLASSKNQEFEKANELKNQIMALRNVFQHSHIWQGAQGVNLTKSSPGSELSSFQQLQKILGLKEKIRRIEGYDISNIQGQEATGSMIVFDNGQPNKNEYRKFKIRIEGKPNDTAMLQEIIERRLKHTDWPMPQVILIDGGKAQLNAAIAALKSEILNPKSETPNSRAKLATGQAISNFQNPLKESLAIAQDPTGQTKFKTIKMISLAKKNNELFIEGRQKPILLKNLPQEVANLILYIRNEAHRFAITYHKKLRNKNLLT